VKQRALRDSWLAYPKPGHAVRLDRGDDHHHDDDDDD